MYMHIYIPWRRKWQPLQYSCLGNSMDRGAWWATVYGFTRVRHSLATKPPHTIYKYIYIYRKIDKCIHIYINR